MRSLRLFALGLAAAGLLAPADGAAQVVKLLGTVGLGRPTLPLDGRAQALGGAAVALHGGNLSAVNPASLARFAASGIWISYQPESRRVSGAQVEGDIETARFPLFRAVLPLSRRWVFAAAFAGVLDRNWGVSFTDSVDLSTGFEPFEETRTSDGGITQLRLEGGYLVSEEWTAGAALSHYFGESRLEVERLFTESTFQVFRSAAALRYSGWALTLGGEYQPSDEIILGAVATWRSRLTVRDDTTGAETDLQLPIGLDMGLSWKLAPDILFATAMSWANWSSIADDLPDTDVSDSWRIGAGFEAQALRHGSVWTVFLRLGGSLERYPFELEGGSPWERALGLGLGAQFIGGRGRFDAALEFGRRGDAGTNGVEESFTRYTLSIAVFTN